ncbi:hypothetical protein ACFQZ4_51990 [Catellatospora coxensis]|uniref:Uncharacterized protein n=1 Tax=Catellatospora coxensis TaxID=310354 RepID=A0A8J3P7S8_9ACTN|nr:hypothetical protein [Catellatospora coxensis]GIG06799.1 hypothetical protein Cco03nite_34990 [Catellatospora coxensis]
MDLHAELRRVLEGPLPGAVSEDFLQRFTFTADDPRSVIALARDALATVLDAGLVWPDLAQWRDRLPERFVAACAPERDAAAGQEDAARSGATAPGGQHEQPVDAAWELSGWLHWFDPDGDGESRGWQWWDAGLDGPSGGWIDVQVEGHPFPSGSLEWLLRASGACDIDG